jgi:cbb3-type cytochrome oxidase subunit 3
MLRRMFHSKLTRELTFVVVLKVLLLTLIWWAFVRGHRVAVDEAGMAAALRLNETQSVNSGGEHHDQ